MHGVALLDGTGKHLWISQEIPAMRGKVIGTGVLDLVVPQDHEVARRALYRALVERKTCTYRVRAGGYGDIRLYECVAKPISGASVVVTWRETTELRELTVQERRVLVLVCEELTNPQIAKKMGISRQAVDNARRRIRRTLGVKGTAGEVRWAMRHGLVR